MSTNQTLFTERLVHVLQSIAFKQQTGRLSIEHVGEQQSKKGEIFFVQGNTVFAHTEDETGDTALAHMMNWQEVHYCFFEGVRASTEISYRNRVFQRPRQTRPLLPIELEQTHPMPAIRNSNSTIPLKMEDTSQTPAIGMPVIPKSVRPLPPSAEYLFSRQVFSDGSIPCSEPGYSSLAYTDPYGLPATKSPTLQNVLTPLPSPLPQLEECIEKVGQRGAFAIFRALPQATRQNVLYQMERRERVVFLLLDGKRTLRNVAQLVHRSELEIAQVIVYLLKRGYIECADISHP